MEDQDLSNFSTSSSHRLPTISATQVLQDASKRSKGIPTGLRGLDLLLASAAASPPRGGLPLGHVTEIYGPPGVGKTTFAIQVAVNALHSSDSQNEVVWLDTGAPLAGPRIQELFSAYQVPEGRELPSSPPDTQSAKEKLDRMHYFSLPTLSHLLTLFIHPTLRFPPPRTSLIIVDNVSGPFATSFPRSTESKNSSSVGEAARKSNSLKAANRKWDVAADLASAMAKMASLQNLAILVVNQVATSLKGVRKATLKPSLSGHGWDASIHNRIVLFRDFAPQGISESATADERRRLRFAEILKVAGKLKVGAAEDIIIFVIDRAGLREIRDASSPLRMPGVPVIVEQNRSKRKADEIADSEDEEVELGSDDDFGIPDEDLFHGVLNGEPDLPV